MSSSDLPAYVRENVEVWTRSNADYTDAHAREAWSKHDPHWGVFGVPESDVGALGDVSGLEVVELGCGTAYFSAWLARRGAHVVGVDPTPAQLDTARRMQREFGLEFPLIAAAAEAVPLPDASFDLVLSEYGASIWADPLRWVPEAARLLHVEGRLVFLRNSTLLMLCSPDAGRAGDRLVRDHFGLYRIDWPADEGGGVEFHLPHGELLRLLRTSGFEVEDLIELQAPAGAETHAYYDAVSAEWARRWPAEEIWVARKRTPVE
jgi:SAM-dependent methyltransferase